MDRHADLAKILDVSSGEHLRTVPLNGALTSNAAPDLVDAAPSGNRLRYLLGIDNVKNYDGSWTEWGNLVGVPVETGMGAAAD